MSCSLVNTLNVIHESNSYNRWIYSVLEPYLSGVILDIGSGLGDIVSLFDLPQIKEVILSDCDKHLIEKLKQRLFPLIKYRVVHLEVSQGKIITELKDERVDTITCVNMLEHIKEDKDALCRFRDILKPGGRLVILVPALSCLFGTLDACVGHQRRYAHRNLKIKMQSAGFHIETWRYMNIFGVLTWFLAGRVLKQKKFSEKTCHQLDKMVPFLRWIERGFRLPFGQSLLMVGRVPK